MLFDRIDLLDLTDALVHGVKIGKTRYRNLLNRVNFAQRLTTLHLVLGIDFGSSPVEWSSLIACLLRANERGRRRASHRRGYRHEGAPVAAGADACR